MFIIVNVHNQDIRLNHKDVSSLHWNFLNSDETHSNEFRNFCEFFIETYNGRIFNYVTFANLLESLWSADYESYL